MTLQRKKYKCDLILFKESKKLSCQLESLKLRLLEESEARQVFIKCRIIFLYIYVYIYTNTCVYKSINLYLKLRLLEESEARQVLITCIITFLYIYVYIHIHVSINLLIYI
jgi:hypothetical protein